MDQDQLVILQVPPIQVQEVVAEVMGVYLSGAGLADLVWLLLDTNIPQVQTVLRSLSVPKPADLQQPQYILLLH